MNFLYIDPGTGSMLFSLFIGIAAAASFALKAVFLKLKFFFSGGKSESKDKDSIPYVIFSDHKRYWNVFKPVCDEFEKRKIPLAYYTASEDDPVLNAGYEFVKGTYLGSKNRPYARLNMLKADIVLSTTPGLDVYQWKKSRGVKKYVHIPHTVDDLSTYRMFGLDYYDAVLVTGEHQEKFIRKVEEARNIRKKEIVTAGCTYLDAMMERAKKVEKVTNEKITVLVAPSWGKSGILSRFGDKLLSALGKTGFKIIVRPHPQTVVSEQNILKPLQEKFSGENFEWNFDNDNFACQNASDIMITDFSGIIFDYTFIFGKPLIYADTNFDTMPYDADWFEQKIWALRVLPKIGVELKEKDFPEISQIIQKTLKDSVLKESIEQIKKEAWQNRSNAAKTVADYLIDCRKEIKDKNDI